MSEDCKIVSKVVKYGKQHWQLNADGSWSVLAFGFFISTPTARTPRYSWVHVDDNKVPKKVKDMA